MADTPEAKSVVERHADARAKFDAIYGSTADAEWSKIAVAKDSTEASTEAVVKKAEAVIEAKKQEALKSVGDEYGKLQVAAGKTKLAYEQASREGKIPDETINKANLDANDAVHKFLTENVKTDAFSAEVEARGDARYGQWLKTLKDEEKALVHPNEDVRNKYLASAAQLDVEENAVGWKNKATEAAKGIRGKVDRFAINTGESSNLKARTSIGAAAALSLAGAWVAVKSFFGGKSEQQPGDENSPPPEERGFFSKAAQFVLGAAAAAGTAYAGYKIYGAHTAKLARDRAAGPAPATPAV